VDGDSVEGDVFGDEVAGGAGGGGDDGAGGLDEAVEEGGLAGVGSADDGEGEAVAEDASVGEGVLEGGEWCLDGGELGEDVGGGKLVDLVGVVVGGEVDAGLEGGDEGDELELDGGDESGEGAAELAGGDAGLVEGVGLDEVVDGFGLGEVDASGEEGSLGELAGFGEAGSGCEGAAEEIVEQDGGAVGGDLDDVVGGVGVGGGEEGDDGFVEGLTVVVDDFGESGLGGGQGVAKAEQRFGDGAGVGAGEAEDADASSTVGGGDGGDGVVVFDG
jgi:hypothetical protein